MGKKLSLLLIISLLLSVSCVVLPTTSELYLKNVDKTVIDDWHSRVQADPNLSDVEKSNRMLLYQTWKEWLNETIGR